MIINPDYTLCNEVVEFFKQNKLKIEILEVYGDIKPIQKKLSTPIPQKIIVFFGYNANKYILDIKSIDFPPVLVFVEVLTRYSQTCDYVKYRININWSNAISYALNSNEFEEFVDLGNKRQNNKIYNYFAKYNNVVNVEWR